MKRGSAIGYAISGAYLGGKHPLFVSYSLTRRCNGHCSYCGVDENPVDELDFSAIQKIFRQLAVLGLQRISLTGGEPLLHPDFERIVDLLTSLNLEVTCNTNGFLIGETISALQKLRSVTVSIDGPRDVHDAIRGEGSFEKATGSLGLAKERGVPLRMTAVLSNQNVERIDDLVDTARELDLPLWVQPVWHHVLGTSEPNPDLPSPDQMQAAVRRLMLLKKKGAPVANSVAALKHFLHWPKDAWIGCLAGRLTYRLEPNGMFTHCERIPGKPPWIDLTAVPVREAIENLSPGGCSKCWCATQVELQLARNLKGSSIQSLFSAIRPPHP